VASGQSLRRLDQISLLGTVSGEVSMIVPGKVEKEAGQNEASKERSDDD
jgi:hypothetical protein